MAGTHSEVRAATPSAARELHSPAARKLAELTAIFDDLQFVLGCCERLVAELARGEERDDVVVEALWLAALTAYARCFRADGDGERLLVTDLSGTELTGDVVEWHSMLGKLREHLVLAGANPREAFTVGASQAQDGKAAGIVVTSSTAPKVDDRTVRQTGGLAYALGRLVDERIVRQQEIVFGSVRDLPATALDELPEIGVAAPPA
ncbi:hypothetical protein [Amycolatopsis minnesotensis]|uniref:Uncharacterized protein n=1 Tax=Amycolatopsis minnesotensis TaxID=337894 RepID=A0ABP5C2E3_9PSEU